MLLRAHADIVAHDQEFWQEILEHDFAHADEHYAITLLVAWGLEPQLDCTGGTTFVDWQRGSPYTFREADIDEDLLDNLRAAGVSLAKWPEVALTPGSCHFHQAILFARTNCSEALLQSFRAASVKQSDGGQCPLFARKFPKEATDALYTVMLNRVLYPTRRRGMGIQ